MKLRADDLELAARSEGLPQRLDNQASHATYEQTVEFTVDSPGRYRPGVEGRQPRGIRPAAAPSLPGLQKSWELRPRVFVDVLESSLRQAGRPVFLDYATEEGSLGMPGRRPGGGPCWTGRTCGKPVDVGFWSPAAFAQFALLLEFGVAVQPVFFTSLPPNLRGEFLTWKADWNRYQDGGSAFADITQRPAHHGQGSIWVEAAAVSGHPGSRLLLSRHQPRRALAELVRAISEDQGLTLLTGEPGTGKTVLCHRLLDKLSPAVTSAFLTNSHLADRTSLLQAILYDLTLPYEGRSEQELRLALDGISAAELW